MLYVLQIAAFGAVSYFGLRDHWTDNGYALTVVAFLAALLVTAIVIEIRELPARLSRVRGRLFGLRDQPSCQELSLTRSTRHVRNPLEEFSRSRIGEDRR